MHELPNLGRGGDLGWAPLLPTIGRTAILRRVIPKPTYTPVLLGDCVAHVLSALGARLSALA